MNPLMIDDAVKAKIATLIDYAEKHPLSMDDLLDMHNNAIKSAGERPEYMAYIPISYMVVYTIEDHVPRGLMKHLSISVRNPERLPSREAVVTLMPLFGFRNTLEDTLVKIDGPEDGHQYISLWEVLTPA